MGVLDLRIQIQLGPQWHNRNQRIGRLKSKPINTAPPSDPSSSTASTSNINGEEIDQTAAPSTPEHKSKPVKYMSQELYWAAAKDDVDKLIEVMERTSAEHGLDFSEILEQTSPSGNTLLHLAASHRNKQNAALIIYHARQNSAGDTALHIAAKAGFYSDFVFKDYSCYQDAVQRTAAVMEMLVADSIKLLNIRNGKGNTALHEYVLNSTDYDDTLYSRSNLVIRDPKVCYLENNEGKSPLYLAAEAGKQETVSIMLHLARNVDDRDKHNGKSPFLAAILRRDTVLGDIILRKEPKFIHLEYNDAKTPLHHAASKGYSDMVQYLLNKDVSSALLRDGSGFFPIHLGAAHGHIEVIKTLLEYCYEPKEMVNNSGQNILHIAAARGKTKVVCFILSTPSLASLINEKDCDGNTPLHLSAINWHPKIVGALTWDKRVDLGAINNTGLTALDAAEYYMEISASFDKRLTWTLKAACVPRAPKTDKQTFCSRNLNQPQTFNADSYKDRVNTLLLVATLVATVTFAAGFTMPGGYNDSDPNKGIATMLQKKAFYVFVFSDTIAMYSSILVAISLIWAQLGDLNLVFVAVRFAIPLLGVSLAMLSLAFMAGVYLAVSKLLWLAYAVLIMGSIFLISLIALFFPLCFPISSGNRFLRYLSYYPLHVMILITVSSEDEVTE